MPSRFLPRVINVYELFQLWVLSIEKGLGSPCCLISRTAPQLRVSWPESLYIPQSHKDSSQLPPPDALGWAKEPILPWVQIPHWQLTGEEDDLVETVVGLMEFHRLNLGFLACKGLNEKRV